MAATLAADAARAVAPYRQDQRFFIRYAAALAAIIVFAFAQAAVRGFADPIAAPWWVHLHAALMLGWLGLLIAQNVLARNGSLALHRQLGWLGAGLVAAIVALGVFTGQKALELNRIPPFFTPAYFLGLTHLGVLIFGATVVWAIALRKQTQWHRRLMMGATILLLEPAFGRILPMPLLMPYGEWAVMVLQLAFAGIIMGHDKRTLGRVHPASIATALLVTGSHTAFELFAHIPAAQAFATAIAASSIAAG